MEKSIILTFIKFFDECIISKRMKKVKNWLQFITFLLALIFCGMFTNIIVNTTNLDENIQQVIMEKSGSIVGDQTTGNAIEDGIVSENSSRAVGNAEK